jgi:hypothetical protein
MITGTVNCLESFAIRPKFRRGERAEAVPLMPPDEPEEPSDLEEPRIPGTDDDPRWDVFLPDGDPYEPMPEPGDFWIDAEE